MASRGSNGTSNRIRSDREQLTEFIAPRAASPISIPKVSRQPSFPLPSPTFSVASTDSSQSSRFSSSRASSASSLGSAPDPGQWGNLNQQVNAMFPQSYAYDLPCEFEFQGCGVRFHAERFQDWLNHSISHFKNFPPPPYTICTFCDQYVFESQGDPFSTWQARMMHIRGHFQNLQSENSLRPDFHVIEYAWCNGLLSRSDYDSARRYSERPSCNDLGIVSAGYKTPEIIRREELGSRIIHNDHHERRESRNKQKVKGKKTHQSSRTHQTVKIDRD